MNDAETKMMERLKQNPNGLTVRETLREGSDCDILDRLVRAKLAVDITSRPGWGHVTYKAIV